MAFVINLKNWIFMAKGLVCNKVNFLEPKTIVIFFLIEMTLFFKSAMTDQLVSSSTIDVDITSTPTFNVVANMEGPNRSYLKYIEEKTKCVINLSYATTGNFEVSDDSHVRVSIAGDNEESVEKAKELVNNLIQTVSAQKQRQIQQKAAKKAKKRKSQTKTVDLPQQLMIAMRYYFPGPEGDLPPPGSTSDVKLHKRKFRQVAAQQHWFN